MRLPVRVGERVSEPVAWPRNRDDPTRCRSPARSGPGRAYDALGPDDLDPYEWGPDVPGDADDDAGPWTGDGEAFAAGFLHHAADGQHAVGFASGGELDVLEPGPQLARFVADATSGGHRQLGESELIGVLCACQRLGAWAAAGQAAALTTLSARRRAQARERDNAHLAGHVTDEVAAALVLTGRAAQQLAELLRAQSLSRPAGALGQDSGTLAP
jgi:hypothetical protein